MFVLCLYTCCGLRSYMYGNARAACCAPRLPAAPARSAPVDAKAAAEFSEEMRVRHGFDPASLAATFKSTSRLDSVLAAMVKPAEKKPWHAYRPIFLTAERIGAGNAFWDEHAAALAAMRVHPAMDQARGVLAEWTDRARNQVASLPDCDAKLAMLALCDSVQYRDS